MITYAHSEDEGIYFDPDGTGFVMWSNPFVMTIDTFSWSLENGFLSMTGRKLFLYYHDALSEEHSSKVLAKNISIRRIKCNSLDGDEIEALLFPNTSFIFPNRVLGFMCKDIRGLEPYSEFMY